MEDDQALKHMCKFCYKSFPCGRSLGGHMRSHLINIPFDHNQKKTDKKLPKKKLPPLINHKNNPKIDDFVQESGEFGYEKTNTRSKICKECGKSFQSWKALFGHMKCHSVNGKAADSVGEDSWNSSNESYDESGTPLCRKKRSQRMKRYTSTTNSCSFNTIPNFSPCVSEIDQQEEEEVALSLILLSRDSMGNSPGADSVIDSSDNSSVFLQAKILSKSSDTNSMSKLDKIEQFKSLRTVEITRNREVGVEVDEYHSQKELLKKKKLDIEGTDHEVNSPKKLIKKRGLDQFETEFKKEKSSNRKLIASHDSTTFSVYKSPSDIDFDSTSKFTCTVCKKAFASYQALGGHRASHKKFNGCCAPVTENSHENDNPPNQQLIKKSRSSETPIRAFAAQAEVELGLKKTKEHECPICFKVFRSAQALGGHKRSHLIAVQANNPNVVIQKPEVRDFLDLNLPAPDEEEEQSNELTPWWIGARNEPEPELKPLLGLLSS